MRELKINKSFTRRDHDSLSRYLHDIGRYPVLSPDEEVRLAIKVKGGDTAALDRLVNANLRFVISVAKKYEGQGLPLPDLISEGNMGLIKAAEKFDHTKGFKFISFAVWWIRQSIMIAISTQKRMIRLPMNQITDLADIRKAETDLEQKLERSPSIEEIAEHTGIPLEKLMHYRSENLSTVSYDVPEDDDFPNVRPVLHDKEGPSPDGGMISSDFSSEVSKILATLPVRNRKVLEMSFGLQGQQMQLDDIADVFGMSKETIRKSKNDGLNMLREHKQLSYMLQYL
ncbi:sigma-70 family RNA polymerase sigma factor [Pedobacter deserti]|uniref:sigma-70 family RNA polymerase sigma factor n=1 Tax=Pedobacter deserti TaxID=2817382 RepID=UPI002109630B|nr:sigma-70 family RNA polymerase sigma factor [Pedobacter sp. SYSU D00382]